MKTLGIGAAVLCLSGCTLLPIDERHGGATIRFFKESIECEIAAVAIDPRYGEFKLSKWVVKTGLDLTLIETIGGDGKATVPTLNPTLPTVFPSASLSGKFTHAGHIDFAVSIPEAIAKYGNDCVGPDPSQSHLGLAGWIAATLDQVSPQNHGGLTYTVDVDVTANAGARFGFVFSIINTVDAGFGYTREGVNHLVVSMSEPTPPPSTKPIAVRVVGPVRVIETKPAPASSQSSDSPQAPAATSASPAVSAPASAVGPAPRQRFRATPQFPSRNPALDDPNLNRLLQQQSPVRLAPGTVVR